MVTSFWGGRGGGVVRTHRPPPPPTPPPPTLAYAHAMGLGWAQSALLIPTLIFLVCEFKFHSCSSV